MRRIVCLVLYVMTAAGAGSCNGGALAGDGSEDAAVDDPVGDDVTGEDITGEDAIADSDGSEADAPPGCEEGETRCSGNVHEACSGGEWVAEEDCAASGMTCAEGEGCRLCEPGALFCDGDLSMLCAGDGRTASLAEDCGLLPGGGCDEASGECLAACELAEARRSGAGCEFWAVDLDNSENVQDHAASAPIAVVVANPSDVLGASVSIFRDRAGAGEPVDESLVESASVPAGGDHVFVLPPYDADGPDSAPGQDDGPQTCLSKRSFRIESDVPILACQLNPYENVFSNDASALLPAHGLGTSHHVVGWTPANPVPIPSILPYPNRSYVTIVGTADGTHVTVNPSFNVEGSLGTLPDGFEAAGPLAAGSSYDFVLGRYEVLNLEGDDIGDPRQDPSGTVVVSDAPVAVFSGVDLALVGDETPPGCSDPRDCNCCADHLEMQVLPDDALGMRFVASHSPWRSAGGWIEVDYYRILAVDDGTSITTTLADFPSFTLDAAEFREIKARTGFVLEASSPVQLVQILTARDQTAAQTGDPSMLAVPSLDGRGSRTVFSTGQGFSQYWVLVSLPRGADALLDGASVSTSCGPPAEDGTLGGIVYDAYYCPVDEGPHAVDGSGGPVGALLYAYAAGGSYAMPAGFDL